MVQTEKLLKRARIVLVEKILFEAILLVTTMDALKQANDAAGAALVAITAKADINSQIRGFSVAKIMPVIDIHKCLWKNAQAVVRGSPLE